MNDVAPINTLAGRATPGIGHNQPPLADQIAEEIAAERARADELVEAAREAVIADDDDATKVVTLIKLIRDHEKVIDRAREDRKRPFLESSRIVDAAFGAVLRPLAIARAGADGRGGLGAMLNAWERGREEQARKERERIAAEQRAIAEEAERARQVAEAAKAQGAGSVAAELEAIRKQEEAARLAREADAVRPEPIRTTAGSVMARRETSFEITDIRKALGWLVKMRGAEIAQAARTIIGSHLRSMGVDAAASAEIPGVTVTITSRSQVR